MKNYFKAVIEKSEYLKIFIIKFLGDNEGKESYKLCSDVIKMAENIDDVIINPKILKEFVWYYNLYLSDDTRHNIDLKLLRNDLKEIKRKNCDENNLRCL